MRRTGRRRSERRGGVEWRKRSFHGTVVRLLIRAGLSSTRAVKLLVRWYRTVDQRWQEGKTPENVARHLLKYERQGVVCPCASRRRSGTSRDEPRCVLLGPGLTSRGTSEDGRDLARKKGRAGDTVMCRSRLPWRMVDVHSVRDADDREIQSFSTKALLRLLAQAEHKGDDASARRIERELDRRGKGF